MNFFEHQHQARKSTKFLVVLFIFAVIGIVAAVTGLVSAVWMYMDLESAATAHEFASRSYFFTLLPVVAPIVILIIGVVSWTRMLRLGSSGAGVAEFLGGELLELGGGTNERDLRLKNVVEEMSIASGVPVPRIYVLRGETGINAFAAGTEPSNAVIGVTQGTVDTLTRDELQGVIAHEYSHIFNGDMRLNIRLMGVLAGIVFLTTAGRLILEGASRGSRRSSKNNGAGAILFLGLGLIVIGFIGSFFARWIKAAVSRQREFLADASAVQYTRNPNGIGGALMRIQASHSDVSAGGAEEASHMFFGAIKNFALFATHPPLEERLARIGRIHIEQAVPSPTVLAKEAVGRVGKPRGEDFVKAVSILGGIEMEAKQLLYKPRAAMEMVLALLAQDAGNQKVLSRLSTETLKLASAIPPERALAAIDLALPALRQLEPTHAANFLLTLETMISDDGKIQPLEIAVLSILRKAFGMKSRGGAVHLKSVHFEAVSVLKILAGCGTSDETKAKQAFIEGAQKIGLDAGAAERDWYIKLEDHLAIVKSLTRLSALAPRDKSQFFEAMWLTANHDKQLNLSESLYLRAFSEALEIPLPATVS